MILIGGGLLEAIYQVALLVTLDAKLHIISQTLNDEGNPIDIQLSSKLYIASIVLCIFACAIQIFIGSRA